MKTWLVTITGLGGPMGEFHKRTYRVHAQTPGSAVDTASDTYTKAWSEYEFCSADVVEQSDTARVIDVVGADDE